MRTKDLVGKTLLRWQAGHATRTHKAGEENQRYITLYFADELIVYEAVGD